MSRLAIETYAKVKTLMDWVECHDELPYAQSRAIIEGVDAIWAKVERRQGGRNHGPVEHRSC